MKVIIFEGPDRVGKSTIAEALAAKLGTEVFMTNSKECFTDKSVFSKDSSDIARFNLMIAKYIEQLKRNGILDKPVIIYRSFLSEMVYSLVMERETDEEASLETDEIYAALKTTIVLLNNNRTENFSDDILKDDKIRKSKEVYDILKDTIQTEVIEIDTTAKNVEDYVDSIISFKGLEKYVK